jgi:hypothetical protein
MNPDEIRCNNCMKVFKNEDELTVLEEDGEFYKGCGDCRTDAYLMDMFICYRPLQKKIGIGRDIR